MMFRVSFLRRNYLRILFGFVLICFFYRHKFRSVRRTSGGNNVVRVPLETFVAAISPNEAEGSSGCPVPRLEMYPPEMANFFHETEPLVCCDKDEQNWVYVEDGKVYIRGRETHCNYVDFRRISDYETAQKSYGIIGNGTSVCGNFFKVRCVRRVKDEETHFRNVYATIKRLDNAVERSRSKALPSTALNGMNVYMLGFDSVSHMTYQRKLPKFYSYLKLRGTVILNKYNIVGDGTPQALIPLLTGKTESELPAIQKRYSYAKHVNVLPFIWNEFENASYVTLYGEDAARIGTFTYRFTGFDKQPTDHYMRTFYTVAENEFSHNKKYCWGCDRHHMTHFKYVQDFFDAYYDVPKFAFQFHSVYSHGNNNQVQVADEDMISHVETLRKHGHLNNTMLIVMADHGPRFADIRMSQQGKLEERLPMMALMMPEWFQQQHPAAMTNLRHNADVLTSPFDVHATFNSILNFNANGNAEKGRSRSLFSRIPRNRTCNDIGIEPHWCSCLRWSSIDITSSIIIQSVDMLIETINKATKHQRKLCIPLQLKKIESAEVYSSNKELLSFKSTKDYDQVVPEFHSKPTDDMKFFQIRFLVTPGDKRFEASVKYDTRSEQITTNLADISHINKFSHLPDCVIDIDYSIIKWCVCRNWRTLVQT